MSQQATVLSGRHGPSFDGHGALFLSLLDGVERYGEYGMGQSTLAVAQRTSARIRDRGDTAQAWRDHVRAELDNAQRDRAQLVHVDLGEVGNWGLTRSPRRDAHHRGKVPAVF